MNNEAASVVAEGGEQRKNAVCYHWAGPARRLPASAPDKASDIVHAFTTLNPHLVYASIILTQSGNNYYLSLKPAEHVRA